ncbi:hypothetical protein [Paraclostridium bifermentans]|uniref:hypothetical protein n=1 Tax=Paraclostridium bifermentans TaxID=1490 RepID=UPI00359C4EF9
MNERSVRDILKDLTVIINKNFKGVVIIDEVDHKTGKSYGIKESIMKLLCNEVEKIIRDGDFVCSSEDIRLSTPCNLEKVIKIGITKKVIKKTELALDKTLLNKQEILNIEFTIDDEYDEYLDLKLNEFKSTIRGIIVSKKISEMDKKMRDMEVEKQRLLSLI